MADTKDFWLVSMLSQDIKRYTTDNYNDNEIFDPFRHERKRINLKTYLRWKGKWEVCDAMACENEEEVKQALELAYTIPLVKLEKEVIGMREYLSRKEKELEQLKNQINEKAKDTRTTSN